MGGGRLRGKEGGGARAQPRLGTRGLPAAEHQPPAPSRRGAELGRRVALWAAAFVSGRGRGRRECDGGRARLRGSCRLWGGRDAAVPSRGPFSSAADSSTRPGTWLVRVPELLGRHVPGTRTSSATAGLTAGRSRRRVTKGSSWAFAAAPTHPQQPAQPPPPPREPPGGRRGAPGAARRRRRRRAGGQLAARVGLGGGRTGGGPAGARRGAQGGALDPHPRELPLELDQVSDTVRMSPEEKNRS